MRPAAIHSSRSKKNLLISLPKLLQGIKCVTEVEQGKIGVHDDCYPFQLPMQTRMYKQL
jgi:hypothetical protein